MSDQWELSSDLVIAQLQATLHLLDADPGNARVVLYTTTRPASITEAHADTPQAVIDLQKPCGAIVDGALVLYPLDSAGALVAHQGLPRWGDILAAGGAVVLRVGVSDMDNGGGIRVRGAETPAGETSPLLYAGARVQLGAVALT